MIVTHLLYNAFIQAIFPVVETHLQSILTGCLVVLHAPSTDHAINAIAEMYHYEHCVTPAVLPAHPETIPTAALTASALLHQLETPPQVYAHTGLQIHYSVEASRACSSPTAMGANISRACAPQEVLIGRHSGFGEPTSRITSRFKLL